MMSACDWHHCDAWWKKITECPACHATAIGWSNAVIFMSLGQPTTPLTGFNNDGSKSSLKQIWRPWDWRMPADIRYARSFLENSGRILSMMNGKVLTAVPNVILYVTMQPYSPTRCKCCGLVSNNYCATMILDFLERGN